MATTPCAHDRCAPPRSRLRIHAFPKPPPEHKMHDDGQSCQGDGHIGTSGKQGANGRRKRRSSNHETAGILSWSVGSKALRTNSSPLLGPLCARKSARSLSARTGMRWRPRCWHSNRDASSRCHLVQNHPGSAFNVRWKGPQPTRISPRRNLETSEASGLICRTCYCIEVG